MANKSGAGRKGNQRLASTQRPFHERFDIAVDLNTVQKNFVNRMMSVVFDSFLNKKVITKTRRVAYASVALSLGERYIKDVDIDYYIQPGEYHRCLQAVETVYKSLEDQANKDFFNSMVRQVISISEIDLGISWKDGIFVKTGAKLLDEALVNEPLQWLSEPKYRNVLEPFEKALRHYLEATRRPELLADTVTDMYEALEALAKVVTRRPSKDLSENAELFIRELKLSQHYSKMLKGYISYANEFRHAVEEGKQRPTPPPKEVEAFIYTTGLFIRLAIAEQPTTSSTPGT